MRTSEGSPSASRPTRRRRRWVSPVVILGVLGVVGGGGYVAWTKLQSELFQPSCTATASGATVSFSPEQTANAALIAAISDKRGLPARAATIAIATAIQESKLRNLTFGDRDSLGLFQQRPSQGWGTREQILDPTYATNAFYDALVKVDGYENMEITKVAQKVQKSAYPEAYADHETEGRVLASTLRGHSPAGLGCQLKPVTRAADGAAVAADLGAQLGVTAVQNGALLTVSAPSADLAWAAGQWGVARAEAYGVDRVQVADRVWTRGTSGDATQWGAGDAAATATTVTIRIGAGQG
ncbi:MAG: hypothetical protein ABIW80_11010 [Lapillicoccus sp.]